MVPSMYSDMLVRQNQYRTLRSAADLQWNDTLADVALSWASRCHPLHDQPRNSARNEEDKIYFAQLVIPVPSFLLQAVDSWYNETVVSNGTSEEVSETDVGFRDLRSVGCAFASCLSAGLVYCRYYPSSYKVAKMFDVSQLAIKDSSAPSPGPSPGVASGSPAVSFSSATQTSTAGSSSGGAMVGYICAALLFVLFVIYRTRGLREVSACCRSFNVAFFW